MRSRAKSLGGCASFISTANEVLVSRSESLLLISYPSTTPGKAGKDSLGSGFREEISSTWLYCSADSQHTRNRRHTDIVTCQNPYWDPYRILLENKKKRKRKSDEELDLPKESYRIANYKESRAAGSEGRQGPG